MRNHVLYDDLLIKKGGGQAASDLSSIKTYKFLLKLFTLTGLVIGVLWGHAPLFCTFGVSKKKCTKGKECSQLKKSSFSDHLRTVVEPLGTYKGLRIMIYRNYLFFVMNSLVIVVGNTGNR